jgi:hypothetical protein
VPLTAAASPSLPTRPLALARTLHARAIAGAPADEFVAAIERYNARQRKLTGAEQPFVGKTPEGFMEVEFDRMGREWVWLRVKTVTSAYLGADYIGGAYSVRTLVIPRSASREPAYFEGLASPLNPPNRFIVRREFGEDNFSATGQLDLVDPSKPDTVLWSVDPRVLAKDAVYDSALSTGPGGAVTYTYTQYEDLADTDPRATEKGCEGGPALIHKVTVKLKCGPSACTETSRRVTKQAGCGPVAC